jgi:CBS domain-containing protein
MTKTTTTIISDIMRKKIETIEGTASVQQAAKKLKDRNVSSLLIIDEKGNPQGIVSERDLVTKVCYNDRKASAVTNQEIMSYPLVTISSRASPSEAADMMLQNNVRHLLVVDRGNENNDSNSNPSRPIGILTPLDFTRYQEYSDNDKDAIEKILEYYI